MPIKDLTAYLSPNLELPWRDRTFVVPPPSKDTGLKLAAINAVGVATYSLMSEKCPTCGHAADGELEVSPRTREIYDALGDIDLGELSLGSAFAEMTEAGVPGADVDMFAVYAMYYWTLGEETADEVMAAQLQAKAGRSPKDHLPPSKSGRRLESASRKTGSTGSRSTRGTTSRKS